MSLLEIDDFCVGVDTGDGSVELVRELSLSLERGETLCIVGESGSGKTVTALSVIRLLEFVTPTRTSGAVRLEDVDLTALTAEQMRAIRGRRIGMVFQEAMDSLNPAKRIGAQLVEAYRPAGGPVGTSARDPRRRELRDKAEARAQELLGEVGFPDPAGIMNRYPHQLSGGMQQRVMIAMALMSGPDLLLADEPTTALDATTQKEILRLFRDVQRAHQMACVFITHDMGVAAEIADRIAVLYAGRLVEIGPAGQVLGAPRHRYTRALVECVPQARVRRTENLPSITGSVPGPAETLPGCRFAPRCSHSVDRCVSAEPVLSPLDEPDGGEVACWNPGDGPVIALDAPVTDAPVTESSTTDAPPTEAAGPVLVVEDVRKTFTTRGGRGGLLGLRRREEVAAVDGVSLEIRPGEFFGLVGESGSGKTTLGQLVTALDDPTGGQITVAGWRHDPKGVDGGTRDFRRTVQLIFQDPQNSLDPRHTVERIIAEPLRELTGLRGEPLRRRVAELLEEVGLPSSIKDRIPAQISGGQCQRVAIARAIAPEPRLIVADEPTSALDVSVQGQVINLLLELRRERDLAYLFISHNLSLVLSVADRVGVMKDGRLIEVGTAEEIASRPRHEYTKRLLAASPDLAPRRDRATPDAARS
ncbi:dipeptide ABC transporter ATP-binding protein [Actinomadura spongiicola]|uniref:Dipeptide ABC transporter ATP-binding protein n=1 Tax=Actinomadura spongiicola TaxID=2303421 RepID=A0A372GCB6_9ACTN|nr:ABC transporter ATP-binding protein [Actinomadura spongiicola]RFS83011.1 dipeptide ABC transporter ATP-binding protein [Actinomadura spongiicola]